MFKAIGSTLILGPGVLSEEGRVVWVEIVFYDDVEEKLREEKDGDTSTDKFQDLIVKIASTGKTEHDMS